ncbi:MAG: hypothetical protein GC161_00255 [Planctomycetaceae bacterium]|nr:hypothetical protein [Planctomycetaceae bacterium]
MHRSPAVALATSLLPLAWFAAAASAQTGIANWTANGDNSSLALASASQLFAFGGPAAYAQPGAAIRLCFGIDQAQGGANQDGRYRNTGFRILQGWGPGNQFQGNQVGRVSLGSATVPSLAGDACFSPVFASVQPGLASELAWFLDLGLLTGTAGAPVPSVWATAFPWTTPIEGSTRLGADSNGYPLLANVIYEIQGPANAGPSNLQYYLVTTEQTGVDPAGAGGVANGNNLLASGFFGVPAEVSGAVSHTRLSAATAGGGLATMAMGLSEVRGDIAFDVPQLWARNDGREGAGGPDWRVSGEQPSLVDLRVLDAQAAAEDPASVLPEANPCITANRMLFLWSATPADGMLQRPMSWDSSPIALGLPPQPGSYLLGPVETLRRGPQTVPINYDALTVFLLGSPGLTLGTPVTPATTPGGFGLIFQGGFTQATEGVSTLSGGGAALVSTPMPTLAGRQLGVAAVGIQFDTCVGALYPTEFASSLQISLQ